MVWTKGKFLLVALFLFFFILTPQLLHDRCTETCLHFARGHRCVSVTLRIVRQSQDSLLCHVRTQLLRLSGKLTLCRS